VTWDIKNLRAGHKVNNFPAKQQYMWVVSVVFSETPNFILNIICNITQSESWRQNRKMSKE